MIWTAVRWLISSVVLLLVVTVLTSVLVTISPGDAAKAILGGESATYTQSQYRQVRHSLGIDQPLPVQYWHWLSGLLHGSLGNDLFSGQPVVQILSSRVVPSLSLVFGTVILAGIAGVGIGTVSAWREGWLGRIVDAVSLVGLAIPNFWLALILIELFALKVTAFPALGYTPPGTSLSGWVSSIVLPILALSAGASAFVAKQTRDAMGEVLSREFITMLRAQGLSTLSIVFKHALRNAAIPVVTTLGLLLISLLGGTVVVEQVFALPGLGQLAVTASGNHDLPVIEGVAFYFTILVVLANLLVDVSYWLLNPKVRTT